MSNRRGHDHPTRDSHDPRDARDARDPRDTRDARDARGRVTASRGGRDVGSFPEDYGDLRSPDILDSRPTYLDDNDRRTDTNRRTPRDNAPPGMPPGRYNQDDDMDYGDESDRRGLPPSRPLARGDPRDDQRPRDHYQIGHETYQIRAEGISREVFQSDVCRYLGNNATGIPVLVDVSNSTGTTLVLDPTHRP